MKKLHYLIFSFLLFNKIVFSQNINSAQFEDKYAQQKLEKHETLSKMNSINVDEIEQELMQIDTNVLIINNCGCLGQVDSTYLLVPFASSNTQSPYGPFNANDDLSSNTIFLPFLFRFYDVNFNHLYINNNGNVSFDSAYSECSPSLFPNSLYKMIAPFWADVSTQGGSYFHIDTINGIIDTTLITASHAGAVYYKKTATSISIVWDSVGYYPNKIDKRNTFKLIITNGSDPILPPGKNVAFCYGDMQWTTGLGGVNGFGNPPSTTGVCKLDATKSFVIRQCSSANLVNYLDNKSYYFNLSFIPPNPINVAPIAMNTICDTLYFSSINDSLDIDFSFRAPESAQTTTVQLQPNPYANVVSSLNGVLGRNIVRVYANGTTYMHNVDVIATDNLGATCTQTVVVINPITTQFKEEVSNDIINFSPNPTSTTFQISNTHGIKNIYIKNMFGKEIFQTNNITKSAVDIDVSRYSSGVYLVELQTEDNIIVKKLVVN